MACSCCLSRLQSHIPWRKGDMATRDGTERYVAFTGKIVIGQRLRKEELPCAQTHLAQRRHHIRKHPNSFSLAWAKLSFCSRQQWGKRMAQYTWLQERVERQIYMQHAKGFLARSCTVQPDLIAQLRFWLVGFLEIDFKTLFTGTCHFIFWRPPIL